MSHLAALMLEHWSRISISLRPFPVQVPTLGSPYQTHCGFKQRLGNFRESRYLDRAASGNPKELMDFFLGVWLRYWTDGLLSLMSEGPMPFWDGKLRYLTSYLKMWAFPMTPCTLWWRVEPAPAVWCLSSSPLGWDWLATGYPRTGVGCSLTFLWEMQQGPQPGLHQTG